MPYGTLKIDTITFTDAGVDKSIAVSGFVQNPTFTGNVTVTGTVSGNIIQGGTTVSGLTVTGTTANFASGVFTTQISGTIVKVPAGTAAAPSFQVGTGTTVAPGLYGAGTDLIGISTGSASRIIVDSVGQLRLIGAGSAGAPALIAGNDLTTGLFSGGTGILALSTGGSERARIDSSGRLLVGTSSSITGLFSNAAAVQLNASFGTQALALTRFSANNFGADIDFLKSRNATVGAHTIVQSGDQIANLNFAGSDGTAFIAAAGISANIDGTPGTNDMPGRLVFSTTADGASSPTERMRIDSAGRVGIGSVDATVTLNITRNTTGGTTAYSCNTLSTIQSDVTSSAVGFNAAFNTAAAAFTLAEIRYFNAGQGTIGVGSAVTSQYGFLASANLTGATNNFGFFSNIPAATGRWNFYAGGTADSYFASNNFIFANGGTERARVDSSGRLLVGTSTSQGSGGSFQVGGSSSGGAASTAEINAFGFDSRLRLTRATTGSPITVVASGDRIGRIVFDGYDGAAYREAASIFGEVDGTPGASDMPGRLVFSTTADGAFNPAERMRIDSAGNVGIGGTPGSYKLDVQGGVQRILNQGSTSALEIGTGTTTSQTAHIDLTTDTTYTDFGLRLIRDGAGGANGVSQLQQKGTGELSLRCIEAAPLTFYTTNTERARIDSNGRLLVGTSASITTLVQAGLQAHGTGALGYINSGRWSNDGNRSELIFSKSRGGTVGTRALVSADDGLGGVTFTGDDGASFVQAANIIAYVDGTPGTNDMPGRLVFSTTADGASSSTERWRINNGGTVIYNQPAPAAVDVTATLTVANLTAKIITSTTAAAVTMTLPTGTLMDGGFSGLYNNMAFEWTIINTGGTNAVTVQAGASHTLVGSGTVAANGSGRFLSRRTAATTWVTYRLAT